MISTSWGSWGYACGGHGEGGRPGPVLVCDPPSPPPKPEDMRHVLMECRFLPPAYHIAAQCMGPAIFEDTTETDPEVLLWDMPVLSLQTHPSRKQEVFSTPG